MDQMQEQNLKMDEPIPKDTISTSTGTDSNASQKENNSKNSNEKEKPKDTLGGKIKKWAGNIWNSIKNINLKNMFSKTEYEEIRNANGDIVKIPKKKLPLKKKKKLTEKQINKINEEQNKVITTYHGAATGLYVIY